MPTANAGASRPLSVAPTASVRIADMRTMMDGDPSFGEAGPRLLGLPAGEFIEGHAVGPFGDRRGNRTKHEALHPPSIPSLYRQSLTRSFCASYWSVSVGRRPYLGTAGKQRGNLRVRFDGNLSNRLMM
jgi:hypothetical protein